MSTEYYTGVPFERAVGRLRANLGTFDIRPPLKSRYLPECDAFLIRHENGQTIWGLKEIREIHDGSLLIKSVLPPIGTLTLEAFGSVRAGLFIPWIERVLKVSVMSGVGLPWELDQ